MRRTPWMLVLLCFAVAAWGQTAEELVAKNLAAKGGVEKIKAVKSLRAVGRYQDPSGFTADVLEVWRGPNNIREVFTLQGMSQVQAYDGTTGWQINPFQGRKDPELLGEEDLRGVVEDADFFGGPLVDAAEKGNKVEYLGHTTVDGDDALRLKVTLKNGDIFYYYLDPDTYLEFRTERQQFIRGSVREQFTELGAYKQVNGVYFPFSMTQGERKDMSDAATITFSKLEANTGVGDTDFKMPAAPAVVSPQKHTEPPSSQTQKGKPPAAKPSKPPQP
ncbi:MAG TPA: hypothetical protein VL382_05950 [Terriglobales bacterium]|nr:hypothetical protein [Terriglobales bacterium]